MKSQATQKMFAPQAHLKTGLMHMDKQLAHIITLPMLNSDLSCFKTVKFCMK